MARNKVDGNTRQIYASIREGVYLAAKARASELRIPLREFIEMALEEALRGSTHTPNALLAPSIWDDEYLRMQSHQPPGSPVELTKEEAERVVKDAFASEPDDA